MVRNQKKKSKSKQKSHSENKPVSTDEILSKTEISSENIVRLKITVRKGARIESVPLKKLETLATKKHLYWKKEGDWLSLIGVSSK